MKAVRKVTAQTHDRPELCPLPVAVFYGNEKPVNMRGSGAGALGSSGRSAVQWRDSGITCTCHVSVRLGLNVEIIDAV